MIDKTSASGRKHNILGYRGLAILVLGMVGLMGGNLLIASTYSDLLLGIWGGYAILFLSYFGMIGMGAYIASLCLRYCREVRFKIDYCRK